MNHFDERGQAVMVDVSGKDAGSREAVAAGKIHMSAQALRALMEGSMKKGDVLAAARIAGIMAAKRTSELIPLCHILPLAYCGIDFECVEEESAVRAYCTVRNFGPTGVEMEALTGVSVALLTIYDMCKAVDKRMVIEDVHLLHKRGGKSGDFFFSEDAAGAM